MKIPKEIKIGERIFKIKIKRIIGFDNSIAGQINFGMQVMKLRKDLYGKYKEDTFFHEISHGILKELEFNHPKITKFRNDEVFVQEMGLLLRNTFIDLLNKQDTSHQQNEKEDK